MTTVTPTTNVDDTHQLIQDRIRSIWRRASDDDPEKAGRSSARRYEQDLRWLDAWLKHRGLEPTEMNRHQAKTMGETLANEYNGSTSGDRWRTINKFFRDLWRKRMMDENPLAVWDEDKDDELGITRTSEQDISLEDEEKYAVDQDEVRQIEDAAPDVELDVRDTLIIRMLWQTGLRRGELAGLKKDDVDTENREVAVRKSNAKNGERRVVPYQPTLEPLLERWLDDNQRRRYNSGHGPYLFPTERSEQIDGARVNEIVRDAAKEAGLNRVLYTDANGRERWLITAHNLRHGFGTYLANDTPMGIWEVSKLLGHSSVDITERRYVDPDDRAGVDDAKDHGPD